jgi:hypothetical protein
MLGSGHGFQGIEAIRSGDVVRSHTLTLEVTTISDQLPGWKLKEATDLGSLVTPRRGFQGHFLPGRDVPSGAAGGGAIRRVLLDRLQLSTDA